MSKTESEKVKISSISDELLCPVCMTVPRSLPIPCCPKGHLMCQTCHTSLQNDACPTCRLPMGGNVSTVAGALVEKIPHSCRYSHLGCEKMDFLKDIWEHEKYCLFSESERLTKDATNVLSGVPPASGDQDQDERSQQPGNLVSEARSGNGVLWMGSNWLRGAWPGHTESQTFSVSENIESVAGTTLDTRIKFVAASGGLIPANAFPGGEDQSGETLYVGRAMHQGSKIPGKLHPSHGVVYVSWGGKEHAKRDYEVLVQEGGFNLQWVSASNGSLASTEGILSGHEADGNPLYIGRAMIGNRWIPGKISTQYKMCFVPYGGKEHGKGNYQVLCTRSR